MQRLGAVQLPAAEWKAQGRNGFVEKPRPGGPPGDVFLVQQLLDVIAELVGPKGARIA
jgi:hypothetical protein